MAQIFLPTNLFDSSGFRWDIQGNGSIIDGSNDAYDGGLNLNNFPSFTTAETEDNNREVAIGPTTVSGVEVKRKIYVPTDQSWARFLEIVTNTSSSTANYTVNLNTNLGSDSSTVLVGTKNGDNVFNTEDNWLVTDDLDNGGDPTMLHVIAGENGIIKPSAASLNVDNINFAYNLTLAPGETQIVMHFAVQNPNQATALAKAPELETLELNALAGMSAEEIGQVVNFATAPSPDLIGTENDDILTGSNRGERIFGFGGNDIIQGLGGKDQIFGGGDNDQITAGNGNDTVEGGAGDDIISGDAGNDTLSGNEGQDDILGGDGNDQINGGSDSDRLLGEAGDDTISGEDGNDTINGGDGNDSILGGNGNDRMFGSSGNDNLSGNAGTDTIIGGFGNDTLNGGEGDDRLIGVEPLIAGTGIGFGAGEVDTLTGSGGRDTFVLGDSTRVYYLDGDPLTTGELDYALITDFNQGEDVIQLQGGTNLYSLDFFPTTAGRIDAALIYDPGVTARGEVIGILQNVSPSLSISSGAFTFI
jgi:Ca2+-binding RTX toxin-like protein